MLHPLCDWSPGRQFNRRKNWIVREFEREQGKAGVGQEFTGGAAREAGDGRIGEADVGGEDVVGGVGVEEEGEEGEAGGKKDREVFASRSENNYYYYRVVFLTGPTQQEKMTKYTGPTQDLLTQKSSQYGTGTPQQEKMTKYTGPT